MVTFFIFIFEGHPSSLRKEERHNNFNVQVTQVFSSFFDVFHTIVATACDPKIKNMEEKKVLKQLFLKKEKNGRKKQLRYKYMTLIKKMPSQKKEEI